MKSSIVASLVAATLGLTSCTRSQTAALDCERAIEAVGRAQPAENDHWAWATLPGCGAAGSRAASDAWKALRSVPDTARIATVYDRLSVLRDSALYETSRALLLDDAATVESRVFSAMLVVTQLIEQADPDYRVFSTTGPHDACMLDSATNRSMRVGAPLPSNAIERAQATALRVLTSQSAPGNVKNAARCAYEALQTDEQLYAQTPQTSGVSAHVTESAGRFDTARVRPVANATRRARLRRRAGARAKADSLRGSVGRERVSGCLIQHAYLETNAGERVGLVGHVGMRVHDGILRKNPRGNELEKRDGRRLPVANLPRAIERADGMRVWIAEPLGAPASAGTIEPDHRFVCDE